MVAKNNTAGWHATSQMFVACQPIEKRDVTGSLAIDGSKYLAEGFWSKKQDYQKNADILQQEIQKHGAFFLRILVLEINLAAEENYLLGNTPEDRYLYFLGALRTTLYNNYILKKYPVVRTVLDGIYAHSIATSHSVNQVIENSKSALKKTFNFDADSGFIVEFLGDRHPLLCRSVLLMDKNNQKLVAKPRSSAPEKTIKQLTALLPQHLSQQILLPKRHDESTWTFQEFVHSDPKNKLAMSWAYSLGCLAAISLVCSARDLHIENLMAASRGPVLIDTECLFSPTIQHPNETQIISYFLNSGLFPINYSSSAINSKQFPDWSALGAEPGALPIKLHYPVNDGTDRIKLVFRNHVYVNDESAPKNLLLDHYGVEGATQVVSGFHKVLTCLAAKKEEVKQILLSISGTHQVRVVLKPTQFYFDLQRKISHPKYLADPANFQSELLELINTASKDSSDGLKALEIQAVLLLGSPCIHVAMNSREATAPDGSVVYAMESSPRSTVRHLSDVIFEQKFINNIARTLKQTLIGKLSGRIYALINSGKWAQNQKYSSLLTCNYANKAEFLPVPDLIFQEVCKLSNSCLDQNTNPTWIDLVDSGVGDFSNEVSGFDIYQGISGIALALRVSDEFHDKTTLIHELMRSINTQAVEWAEKTQRFGALTGVGGAAYVMVCDSILSNTEPNKQQIRRTLDVAVEGVVETDNWDFMTGSSGLTALLGSLRHNKFEDETWVLSRAKKLLSHLDSHADRSFLKSGQLWWPRNVSHDKQLGGIAHGAAGVAVAMDYFKDLSEFKKFGDYALEAQHSLHLAAGSWVDKRQLVSWSRAMAHFSWCHGVGGLLPLGNELCSSNEIENEIARDDWQSECNDLSLCHGLAGNLLLSESVLGGPNRATLERIIARLSLTQSDPVSPENFINGLFMGRSGAILALSKYTTTNSLKKRINPLFLRF